MTLFESIWDKFTPATRKQQEPQLVTKVHSSWSVDDFFLMMVDKHEGGFQNMPEDAANWVGNKLLGTKHGITPRTLADWQGVNVRTLSVDDIKAVTPELAAAIGINRYYQRPKLHLLPWGPAVEAWCDSAYLSGPGTAVKGMQKVCGTTADGAIGPMTIDAFKAWQGSLGVKAACVEIRDWRVARYDRIVARWPARAKFLNGWNNRANRFTAIDQNWRKRWGYE
jgi:lysozyme family protein